MTPIVLAIPERHWREVLDHLRECLPNEGVALLATEIVAERRVVRAVHRGSNIRSSPTRFDMHPGEIVRALRAIDDAGWVLGAIVHSHPSGPPTPSPTDLAEAAYPESLMVIVSFATGTPMVRAWRLQGQAGAWTPVEVSVEILPDGAGTIV